MVILDLHTVQIYKRSLSSLAPLSARAAPLASVHCLDPHVQRMPLVHVVLIAQISQVWVEWYHRIFCAEIERVCGNIPSIWAHRTAQQV